MYMEGRFHTSQSSVSNYTTVQTHCTHSSRKNYIEQQALLTSNHDVRGILCVIFCWQFWLCIWNVPFIVFFISPRLEKSNAYFSHWDCSFDVFLLFMGYYKKIWTSCCYVYFSKIVLAIKKIEIIFPLSCVSSLH